MLKNGFGRVLGSIWEGVGALRAVFWPLLGAFWPFFGRSKSHLFKALVQDELQEAFWMDFGLLLECFGKVFGGILGRFGVDLGGFEELMGRFWTCLTRFGPAGADSLIGPPC